MKWSAHFVERTNRLFENIHDWTNYSTKDILILTFCALDAFSPEIYPWTSASCLFSELCRFSNGNGTVCNSFICCRLLNAPLHSRAEDLSLLSVRGHKVTLKKCTDFRPIHMEGKTNQPYILEQNKPPQHETHKQTHTCPWGDALGADGQHGWQL